MYKNENLLIMNERGEVKGVRSFDLVTKYKLMLLVMALLLVLAIRNIAVLSYNNRTYANQLEQQKLHYEASEKKLGELLTKQLALELRVEQKVKEVSN